MTYILHQYMNSYVLQCDSVKYFFDNLDRIAVKVKPCFTLLLWLLEKKTSND